MYRTEYLHYNRCNLNTKPFEQGVPQRSVLELLFVILFMDNYSMESEYCTIPARCSNTKKLTAVNSYQTWKICHRLLPSITDPLSSFSIPVFFYLSLIHIISYLIQQLNHYAV